MESSNAPNENKAKHYKVIPRISPYDSLTNTFDFCKESQLTKLILLLHSTKIHSPIHNTEVIYNEFDLNSLTRHKNMDSKKLRYLQYRNKLSSDPKIQCCIRDISLDVTIQKAFPKRQLNNKHKLYLNKRSKKFHCPRHFYQLY